MDGAVGVVVSACYDQYDAGNVCCRENKKAEHPHAAIIQPLFFFAFHSAPTLLAFLCIQSTFVMAWCAAAHRSAVPLARATNVTAPGRSAAGETTNGVTVCASTLSLVTVALAFIT